MAGRGRAAGMAIAVAVAVVIPGERLAAQARTVTLDEAVRMAVQVNPAVVRARGNVTNASASKLEAIGSFLPTVSGSSGFSTNSTSRFDERTQTQINGSAHSYSAGLTASLTLFNGFRRFAQNRAATADYASAEAGLVNQEFQIVLQTKQAFFNGLAANDLVRVAERRLERAREQMRISKDKLAAGSAIRSDTLRGRVEIGSAELQRLNAETQRATAEASLARLIGVDGLVRPVEDSSLFRVAELDTAQLRLEALQQSPAVVQAEAQARSAEAAVAVSRAQYFPSLSASYSRSWAGQEPNALTGSWSARLSLSWPLFNGFTREGSMSRSATAREAALATAEDARRQVNAQLTQYLAALAAARQSLAIARASSAAAEEELRVQQERYRLGAATILDVLASQISLDQAEVDMVQARLDFLVAKAQIEAIVGRAL